MDTSAVLWLQCAYVLWQFVRVAKYCRIPYAILVHTFMWVTRNWDRPFAWQTYLVLEAGRTKFYVNRGGAESILSDCLDRTDRYRVDAIRPEKESDLAVISIPAVNYELCVRESKIHQSFVWKYLKVQPACIARHADMLLPNLALLDRVSDLEGLKMMCQGDSIPVKRNERVLAVSDREHELDQNFMRLLSTIPLMAQARGHENVSVWISVAILVVDQFSEFFNWVWQSFSRHLLYIITVFITDTHFRPRTREMLCTFFAILSKRMKFTDQVRRSMIRVTEGDVVYTMSPFNLADFDQIIDRPFTRARKTARPYSEEKFGKFTFCGEEMEFAEGSPVISHYIKGSRIDSIFNDSGEFYNFIDNEHLHFGFWKDEHESDCEDNFNKFQDLLQVMEEMQMLPFIQTDKDRFQNLHFNMFLSPGRSLKDLTFLVAKDNVIIGG